MTFPRCTATTKAGKACTNRASHADGLCTMHSPEARAELTARLKPRRKRDLWEWLASYQQDPVGFARDALGVELWLHQREVVAAVAEHPRVTWRSCNGAGKTVTAVVAWLHGLLCFPHSLAIFLAPNARQIRQVDWRTLDQLVRQAPALKELEPPGAVPELGWRPTPDRLGIGATADKPEGLAGLHARGRVTAVEDEASGIGQAMHEALLGNLTGDSRLLLISNPTQLSGEFYLSHTRKQHLYRGFHTSFRDVAREAAGVPGLIDDRYAAELAADYGELSSVYQVRALGEFPTQASDAVIGMGIIDEARARWSPALASGAAFEAAGPLELGCDPARFGDDSSVIVARRGNIALEPIVFHGLDGVALAARVMDVATRLRMQNERVVVRIDVIGVGSSVFDQLTQMRGPLDLRAINVGEAATAGTFERLRDEIWFSCRDWIKNGGALPPDDKLAGELAAPTFTFSQRQRMKVESKDETKKRLRRSPDRADALCLAVYKASREETTADLWIRAGRAESGPIAVESYSRNGNAPGGFGALIASMNPRKR